MELFEEREHVLVSMVNKLLAANARIYMHHGDPENEEKDPHADVVIQIDDAGDHVSIFYADSASITDYEEADRAKLRKRKTRSRQPIWDLYILS